MPLQVDTLTTIRNRVEADINANLTGADSRLRRNVLWVLSFVVASVCWSFYRVLAYIARQRLPDTMDDDNLTNFGSQYGVDPTAALTASGTMTCAGVDGYPVTQGAIAQTDDGVEFIVTATTDLDGATAVPIAAVVPGASGNLQAGTRLTFVSPVAGVNAQATVASLAGGSDDEAVDYYRGRVVTRLRKPPQGGNLDDYVAWARSINGVTRAWSRVDWTGAGTVGVLFMFDGRDNPYPTADDLATMQALLDRKKPGGDVPYAVAPIANPIAFTIALNPDTPDIRAAIEAELDDLLAREGQPGGTVLLTHLDEAIKLGVGDGDFRRTVPNANVTNTAAQISTRGVITWAAW